MDEKINLIGMSIVENNDSDEEDGNVTIDNEGTSPSRTLHTSYTNNTPYILRILIFENAGAQLDDYNSKDHNFYWELYSTLEQEGFSTTTESLTQGYGGSNNSQYDQRTFDSCYGERYVELYPNEKINLHTKVQIYGDDDNGNGSETYGIKFIRARFIIVGAIDVPQE